MKLIQEANMDDAFANLLVKIDDAYEQLNSLADKFSKDHRPVRSQIAMVESAADDLAKLAKKLKALRES